jgi:fatty-acyl-CoA synthase
MLEAHFGVPLSGGVLNAINTRLSAPEIAFILEHAETRFFIVDRSFVEVALRAVEMTGQEIEVVSIDESDLTCMEVERFGDIDYEELLESAPVDVQLYYPEDEWEAISLCYTSGTTGNPKGVVYHHRGAYLNALGQSINAALPGQWPVYLWTLPLFHCNGWCFAWALAAIGATHVCVTKVSADTIYKALTEQGVTHLCAAPTVLRFLIDGKPDSWKAPEQPVRIICAGASPPVEVLRQTAKLGFSVQHVYGMTEMHGVVASCQWQEDWDRLDPDEWFVKLKRQGVRLAVTEQMIVANPDTFVPVPRDGLTLGEVMFKGNLAMKGYLKNPEATAQALAGGWVHTGDLAVVHEDGYIEVKDRCKDIIVSGGENVSSVEVEDVLYNHPAVAAAAVVAVADQKWGEVPCAIVELKSGYEGAVTAEEIMQFCRTKLAGFKIPRHVIFEPLTRTATGKVQKFLLRSHAVEVLSGRHA